MLTVCDPAVDPRVLRAVADTRALPDFDAAALATLAFLQQQVPAGAWLVTRVVGEEWVVLRTLAPGYEGVDDGAVLRWSDSFCSRMVRGEGPRVAPRSADVEAYAAAPINDLVPIGGYLGFPLTAADGALLGTLCAIDPEPFDDAVAQAQPLLELQARLLSSLLDLELRAARADRGPRAQVVPADGLEDLLERESQVLSRHGSAGAVLVLDRLPAGTEGTVVDLLGPGESVGRLDDDACAVVLPEVPLAVAEQRATALLQQLRQRGLGCRVGVAAAGAGRPDLAAAVVVARHDLASALC